ncbi:hypothetical protein [Paracoccus saliphilus]|uniref:Uncharacterized protein n=1 Tax=Paracoccus saliphilus TaxID=405559 RepID=A0AA46A5T9_9RHOB|nr:hypothetical protein [Paracoccus saliphilus]WCR04560.1 hypothetical protein JHX88_07535 [Paracoccus saliphilus]SIS86811.1 hypothetical protein SAMN05421772_10717 [Paracoccus saliphilus]
MKNFERRLEKLEARDRPIRVVERLDDVSAEELQAQYPGERLVMIPSCLWHL